MNIRDNNGGYGLISRGFHWLVVLLLPLMWLSAEPAEEALEAWEEGGWGQPFSSLDSGALHPWLGGLLLLLMVARLLWRFTSDSAGSPSRALVVRIVHGAFYLLLMLMPVTGVLMTQASGVEVTALGLWSLPTLIGPSEFAHELFEEVHEALASILLTLIVIHVLAALYHHFIKGDGVLKRMWG